MKTRFIALALVIFALTACGAATDTTKDKSERTAYRWEILDVNFSYPTDMDIIENRQIIFNGHPFDAIIMTKGNLTDGASAGFEIEVIAQQNTKIDYILGLFDGFLEYEDRGIYKVGDHEFREICYDLYGFPRCSYLIEANRNFYQFNLRSDYRDDFLRSVEFVI